jgi:SARP family transcriptional regulator, regulator of embCAB operon
MGEDLRICVRTLGELVVTRADGSDVSIDEWKTGKNRDLLRLLALSLGRPVTPVSLVERLWPDVPDLRRRNSLRTAASQIRRTLRTNNVVRRPDGLMLVDAWVDTLAFREHVRAARLHERAGRHDEVIVATRAAEELYRGDFEAHDTDSAWATAERNSLRALRHELLCDAAGSSLALSNPLDARDFATEAVLLNPSSETAHRLLMQAHAELGEVGRALRIFETYRSHLADELGVDPSPQTRKLHLHLLRGWGEETG